MVMDVSQYLRTTFDDSDCDYLDGEIAQRNFNDIPHGDM